MPGRLGPTQRDWVEFKIDLDTRTKELVARVRSSQRLTLEVACETLVRDIKASVDSKTGELRDSIEILSIQGDTGWVGTKLYYAPWVERGTAGHIIRPKRRRAAAARAQGKSVAVVWPEADHPYFQTNHPGATSHPFMLVGKERAKRPIQQRVGETIRRSLGIR